MRQQLEYTRITIIRITEIEKQKMGPGYFSPGWYYQPRLKSVGADSGVPPLKDRFNPDFFTRD
jgi:hypothetical protein